MNDPFFSVIIPVHNGERTIAETLQTVIDQEFRDFEVIVVDDGSIDDTRQIVQEISSNQNDLRIKLITQPNAGPGIARNRGVSEATGKYIAFLDGDDLWFSWTLKNYFEVIQSYQANFISGAWIEFQDDDIPMISNELIDVISYSDFLCASSTGLLAGMCGVAVKRSVFEEVGGFANSNINAEDSDLWLRLGTQSPFIRINSPVSFAYRRSANSTTGDLSKTIAGGKHLLNSEQHNKYPGGQNRKNARQLTIGAHIRPLAVECAKQGKAIEALQFYFALFPESLRSFRYRFLFALPALVLFGLVKRMIRQLFSNKGAAC